MRDVTTHGRVKQTFQSSVHDLHRISRPTEQEMSLNRKRSSAWCGGHGNGPEYARKPREVHASQIVAWQTSHSQRGEDTRLADYREIGFQKTRRSGLCKCPGLRSQCSPAGHTTDTASHVKADVKMMEAWTKTLRLGGRQRPT